jgi:hypothetical protein
MAAGAGVGASGRPRSTLATTRLFNVDLDPPRGSATTRLLDVDLDPPRGSATTRLLDVDLDPPGDASPTLATICVANVDLDALMRAARSTKATSRDGPSPLSPSGAAPDLDGWPIAGGGRRCGRSGPARRGRRARLELAEPVISTAPGTSAQRRRPIPGSESSHRAGSPSRAAVARPPRRPNGGRRPASAHLADGSSLPLRRSSSLCDRGLRAHQPPRRRARRPQHRTPRRPGTRPPITPGIPCLTASASWRHGSPRSRTRSATCSNRPQGPDPLTAARYEYAAVTAHEDALATGEEHSD